jgi:hypothetical protein
MRLAIISDVVIDDDETTEVVTTTELPEWVVNGLVMMQERRICPHEMN